MADDPMARFPDSVTLLRLMRPLLLIVLLTISASAATKPKIISFGRWTTVQWWVGADDRNPVDLRVRPLLVNGEVKEYTTGDPHEITDKVFVIQRVLKVNDRLPGETKMQWTWRPAGWLMVERSNAHITRLNLPEHDAIASTAIWFRDYAAYCGINDSGEKLYAMVYQIGRRKPLLKKLLGPAKQADLPGGECVEPTWERQPVRVTFQAIGSQPVTFSIRSFATEIPPDSSSAETPSDDGQ
jgi:hypothetical protein